MPILYKLFYKTSEDSAFNEVKVKEVKAKEVIALSPLSDHGCWWHKPTGKMVVSNPRYAIFEDGTTNKEDFEWIEY